MRLRIGHLGIDGLERLELAQRGALPLVKVQVPAGSAAVPITWRIRNAWRIDLTPLLPNWIVSFLFIVIASAMLAMRRRDGA
jgi:hypothetical protein